ncbi:MAG: MerR family transcriptional regulator [Desulfomonilia bacterium]
MDPRYQFYRISQLERLSKTARRTIHFYVQTGLLHPPIKSGKTMAYYDDAHYQKLMFIRNAKKKGFPLIAIRTMIERGNADVTQFPPWLKSMELREQLKRKKPRKKAGRAVRERIIEEGSMLFLEKGFRETHVNDIIHRLDIGKGSFYSYFSNKKALFLECVPLIFQRFFSKGWESIRKEKDPYKRLILRAEATIPVIDKFFTIMQLCQDAVADGDPNIRWLGEQIYSSIYRPIEDDIHNGITQGTFREVNPKLASLLLISAMKGINDILLMHPDITPESAHDALLGILTRGLVTENFPGEKTSST